MTAYMLVQGFINDEEQYRKYRQAVMPLIERFGGMHVRGGTVELLEGRQDERRTALFEFPAIEAIRAFWNSPEYGPVRRWCVDAWVAAPCLGRYVPSMPFKHNAARCHRIPRARYRVTNWPAHEAGLRRRGDVTLWLDEAALAGWAPPKRSSPGGQPRYSDLAIELVLTLRLVFHLALRQAEAFTSSVLRLLGLALPVPDHSTLSRRGQAFAGRQPRVRTGASPVHLVLDSTGLELFGQGEWDAEKHGRARRPPARFAGCPAGGSPAAMAQASPGRRC